MILVITIQTILTLSANAFDVETQAIIWSVQSKAMNPSNVEKTSKQYTEMLMAQFDKDRKKATKK